MGLPPQIENLNQRLAKNPRDVLALINRAQILLARQQAEAALADLERALQIAVPEPRLQGDLRALLLGQLYALQSSALLALNRLPEALAGIEQVLTLQPDSAEARLQRARIWRQMGDRQRALQELNALLALTPQSAEIYLARALTYEALQDTPNALADYNQTLKLDASLSTAYVNRGNLYRRANRLKEAEADYRAAFNLAPYSVAACDNLADMLREIDKPERMAEALKVVQTGLSHHPGHPQLLIRLGSIYVDQHLFSQALETLNQALSQLPDQAEALAQRGQTLMWLDRPAEALPNLKRSVELKPDEPIFVFNLGIGLYKTGNLKGAIEAMQGGLRLQPNNREAQRQLQQMQAEAAAPTAADAPAAPADLENDLIQARQSGDPAAENMALIKLGVRAIQGRQFPQAKIYLHNALQNAQATNDRRNEAQALLEMTVFDEMDGNYQQMLKRMERVREIAQEIKDVRLEHIALGNIGGISIQHFNGGQNGIALLLKAANLAHKNGDKRDEFNHMHNLVAGLLKVPSEQPILLPAALAGVSQLSKELNLPLAPPIAALIRDIRSANRQNATPAATIANHAKPPLASRPTAAPAEKSAGGAEATAERPPIKIWEDGSPPRNVVTLYDDGLTVQQPADDTVFISLDSIQAIRHTANSYSIYVEFRAPNTKKPRTERLPFKNKAAASEAFHTLRQPLGAAFELTEAPLSIRTALGQGIAVMLFVFILTAGCYFVFRYWFVLGCGGILFFAFFGWMFMRIAKPSTVTTLRRKA